MKKKIIIIASAAVVVIAALLVVIFSTQSAKKCEKWIENSAKKLTYVQTVFEVTDKEEKVFIYNQTVEIIEENAEITKATSRLNPSFEFSTIEENSYVENVNRDALLNFAFDKKYFKESSLKKNTFIATVKGECLSAFLGGEALDVNGDAQAVIKFEDKKLAIAEITFSLQSGKQVKITVQCQY